MRVELGHGAVSAMSMARRGVMDTLAQARVDYGEMIMQNIEYRLTG